MVNPNPSTMFRRTQPSVWLLGFSTIVRITLRRLGDRQRVKHLRSDSTTGHKSRGLFYNCDSTYGRRFVGHFRRYQILDNGLRSPTFRRMLILASTLVRASTSVLPRVANVGFRRVLLALRRRSARLRSLRCPDIFRFVCLCIFPFLLQRLEVGLAELDVLIATLIRCHLALVGLVEEARVRRFGTLVTLTLSIGGRR